MVRAILATLAMILIAGSARAQNADWGQAGGDLFAGAAPALDAGPEPDAVIEADVPRLLPLTQPFSNAIATAADRYGLDPKLLHALVVVESGYRNEACSPVGACGLAQLMPATASELGVRDRFDPVENLSGGAAYLARQVLRFGDLRLALAAYNSGPERVARLGRIPRIAETQNYVAAVVDCYLALTAGRGVRSSRECQAPGGGQ